MLRPRLVDPTAELYGLEIGEAAGLASGTVHPILARLEGAPLHCRLHLYHHYKLTSADDGHRYLRCKNCGKDYPGTGNGPLDGFAAPFG